MSFYRLGVAGTFGTPLVVGASNSSTLPSPKTLGIVAIVTLTLGYIVSRPSRRRRLMVSGGGPDTSDIQARIRARGLDPSKYGL